MEKSILITLLVGEIILIIGAISGIVGTLRKNACLLFLFSITVVIFTLVFIGTGIAANYIPQSVFDDSPCQNSTQSWLQDAYKAYTVAFPVLCTLCPCNMNNYDGYSNADLIYLNAIHPMRNASNGPVRAQDCALFRAFFVNDTDTLQLTDGLGIVETALGCSGWCPNLTDNSIRMFSNVNNGKPTGYCYTVMRDYVDNYSSDVMWVSIGFGIFLVLVLIGNICLCCHPERKHIKGFKRFIYEEHQDQGYNAFNNY